MINIKLITLIQDISTGCFQISRLGSRPSDVYPLHQEPGYLVNPGSMLEPKPDNSWNHICNKYMDSNHSSRDSSAQSLPSKPKHSSEYTVSLVAEPCILESGSWVIYENYSSGEHNNSLNV